MDSPLRLPYNSVAMLKTALVPVAGAGTRMLPATKSVPKEMLPLVDRPAAHLIAEECAASNLKNLCFITAPGKATVLDYFKHDEKLDAFLKQKGKSALLEDVYALAKKLNISSLPQRNPKGLGHAVLCGEKAVGRESHFAVLLPDDLVDSKIPCLAQMAKIHQRTGASVIAVMEVPKAKVSSYGIVEGTPAGKDLVKITGLVEKPKPSETKSRLAVVGRYILSKKLFKYLKKSGKGALGEIQITDSLQALLSEETIYGYRFSGTRYDTGTPKGWLEANIAYGKKYL